MAPPDTPPGARREISLYFGALMLTLGLADPFGIVNLPILFLLKDTLGLRPPAVAAFEAIALLPLYFGLLFGFLRDRWQPLGLGDRGYLLLAAPVAVGSYVWLAANPVSYASLLATVLVIVVAFQFMDTAAQSLITVVATRHRMTGRLSAAVEFLEVIPRIVAMLLGGWLASHATSPATFLVAALITAAIAFQAFWQPRSIFAEQSAVRISAEDSVAALRRLLRHRPLLPTAAILLLWNFAPGWETPLLYYLSDDIGVSSEMFGICKAVNLAGIAVTALLYGNLCHRQTLRCMLVWSVALNIFPVALFLVVDGAPAAIAVSAIFGLAGGVGNVAVFALLLRSCPKDLEGSAMMLGFSALTLADAGGDIIGSFVYEESGFALCLAMDAIATLCILPVLRWLPSDLIDSSDENQEQMAPTATAALNSA